MRRLPFAALDHIVPGTALVLAPHPDDESLGCGGLIAEACRRGRPPVVAVLTDGTGSHPASSSHPPVRLRAVREAEARAAVAILGLPPDRLHFLGLRDTAAPAEGAAVEAAASRLAELARMTGCDAVLASWEHDPHCDHLAAARIAARAAAFGGLTHLSYPVWGWTLPDDAALAGSGPRGWRLDVSAHLDRKRRAIAAHASQYTDLIADDPAGFRLPAALLAAFEVPYEVFLLP